ncbi:MAG: hypothetical protein IPM79_16535 [Polyangiaceae bacterium]|nr:hypothetical protein [Polyangiaceae bacterium]MBK8939182.1 hypothetical protein [Polyangiaceae bacterium]
MFVRRFAGLSAVLVGLSGACTDEGEADTTTSSGVGGQPPSTGGAGAGTAQGGAGGAGGEGGGAPGACLPESVADGFFTLTTTSLCIVDVKTASGLDLAPYGATPSWGKHGGPLTFEGDGVDLVVTRWSGSGAALTAADETFTATNIPADAFWAPLAVELDTPAGGSCGAGAAIAASWSGFDFVNDGELVTLDESGGVTAQLAAGMYGMAASGERLFFTALSQVGGPTNNNPALYAGDAQATCEGSGFDSAGAVDAWGLSTGPVAVDGDGSLFAILTDFNEGTQEIRAFEAADVAPGAPATTGTAIATLDGYGDALAAIAPEGAAPGLLVVQPNDATDGSHGEVLAIEVTLDAGAFTGAAPVTLLDLTEDDDNVTLMTDDDGRLWVGLTRSVKGQPVSTFFVLDRAPR